MGYLKINSRTIKDHEDPYIIAEIGDNHRRSENVMKVLIDFAKEAGADAVKLQAWALDSLFSKRHVNPDEWEKMKASELTAGLAEMARRYAAEVGIDFIMSVFSHWEVEAAKKLHVDAIKVASMDINHTLLLRDVACARLPVIMSTGMAVPDEIDEAVGIMSEANASCGLMHCVSLYPTPDELANLQRMEDLREHSLPVGFSDHTMGTAVPLAAAFMGAAMIEKHLAIARCYGGQDAQCSATPDEFHSMVQLVRRCRNVSVDLEKDSAVKMRRSIVAVADIKKGHVLQLGDLDFKRPGIGISPNKYLQLLGKKALTDIKKGEILEWWRNVE